MDVLLTHCLTGSCSYCFDGEVNMNEAGELRHPGLIRTIGGTVVDLINTDPDTLYIEDIAWSLGKIIRYNGHIRQDHTVAHHCVIMSYYVAEEKAMEALLHDAAEAYIGDIIWPVKALFPEVEAFENRVAAHIVRKFGEGIRTYASSEEAFYQGPRYENTKDFREYRKSPAVAEADIIIFQHECFSFGNRPGIYNSKMQAAWERAAREYEEWWLAPNYLYLLRYHELNGTEIDWDAVAETWFPSPVQEEAEEALDLPIRETINTFPPEEDEDD